MQPKEDPREIRVHNPHKIKHNTDTKTLTTVEERKRYKVVFDKRAVHPDTFLSYPYGYEQALSDDVDMQNVELLMDLLD